MEIHRSGRMILCGKADAYPVEPMPHSDVAVLASVPAHQVNMNRHGMATLHLTRESAEQLHAVLGAFLGNTVVVPA